MSKTTKPPAQQVGDSESAGTGEFETKLFAKSDYPKTVKETIKLLLNIFVNLLG
jgi:hypothetical protein